MKFCAQPKFHAVIYTFPFAYRRTTVDPLYRLEHQQADRRKAASKKTVLTRLTELSDVHGKDDYSANSRLREGMRKRKRMDREREEEAKVWSP